jgi:hypothetical protein
MLQKKQKINKKLKILKEHGKILSKKIYQKLIECIKSLRLIRKITIKNYLKIV